jgi:pyridoxine/pyridoxamine 5'-phosphate oxidase
MWLSLLIHWFGLGNQVDVHDLFAQKLTISFKFQRITITHRDSAIGAYSSQRLEQVSVFMAFDAALDNYRGLLQRFAYGNLKLPNDNFDTGRVAPQDDALWPSARPFVQGWISNCFPTLRGDCQVIPNMFTSLLAFRVTK